MTAYSEDRLKQLGTMDYSVMLKSCYTALIY